MPFILRQNEEVKLCPVTEAHGGVGTIEVKEILGHLRGSHFPGDPTDFEAPINFVHRVTLPPNTSIGMHPHKNNEEFYYILQGEGTMVVDGASHIMNEGSICLIKKGSEHAFENNSKEDLSVMVMEVEFI